MTEEELEQMRQETARNHEHEVTMAPGGWFCNHCPAEWKKEDQQQ